MEQLLSMTLQEIYEVWSSKFNTFDDMAVEYNVSKKFIDDLMFPILFWKLEENNKRNRNQEHLEKINERVRKAKFYENLNQY